MGAVFSQTERSSLLAQPGIGPGVVRRLEQAGYVPLQALVGADEQEVIARIAELSRVHGWRNNPLALRAVSAAIDLAHYQHEERRR